MALPSVSFLARIAAVMSLANVFATLCSSNGKRGGILAAVLTLVLLEEGHLGAVLVTRDGLVRGEMSEIVLDDLFRDFVNPVRRACVFFVCPTIMATPVLLQVCSGMSHS